MSRSANKIKRALKAKGYHVPVRYCPEQGWIVNGHPAGHSVKEIMSLIAALPPAVKITECHG